MCKGLARCGRVRRGGCEKRGKEARPSGRVPRETTMNKQQILDAIESLQVWFAARPYGWQERATPGQVQQHEDRVSELDALVRKLDMMTVV